MAKNSPLIVYKSRRRVDHTWDRWHPAGIEGDEALMTVQALQKSKRSGVIAAPSYL